MRHKAALVRVPRDSAPTSLGAEAFEDIRHAADKPLDNRAFVSQSRSPANLRKCHDSKAHFPSCDEVDQAQSYFQ